MAHSAFQVGLVVVGQRKDHTVARALAVAIPHAARQVDILDPDRNGKCGSRPRAMGGVRRGSPAACGQ